MKPSKEELSNLSIADLLAMMGHYRWAVDKVNDGETDYWVKACAKMYGYCLSEYEGRLNAIFVF